MKSNFFKLSCLLLLLFTFFGCCEECQTKLEAAELKIAEYERIEQEERTLANCQNDPSTNYNKEDLSLKFDCNDQENFQHLHIDLVNRFSILGKITMESDTILTMKILKKEIGTCNNLKITNFKYTGSKTQKDSLGNNYNIHNFNVQIADNNDNTDANKMFETSVNHFAKIGDIFDIHINPNADKNKPETYDNIYYEHPWTNYGQQFCKSTIIMRP